MKMISHKIKTVFLIGLIVQSIFQSIQWWLWNYSNFELGLLLVVPIVAIIGLGIQFLVTFIRIHDNLLGKLSYAVLGVVLTISLSHIFNITMNFINRDKIAAEKKEQYVREYCLGQQRAFEMRSGFDKVSSTDPKWKELYYQAEKVREECTNQQMSAK